MAENRASRIVLDPGECPHQCVADSIPGEPRDDRGSPPQLSGSKALASKKCQGEPRPDPGRFPAKLRHERGRLPRIKTGAAPRFTDLILRRNSFSLSHLKAVNLGVNLRLRGSPVFLTFVAHLPPPAWMYDFHNFDDPPPGSRIWQVAAADRSVSAMTFQAPLGSWSDRAWHDRP
jgi:hypothetical protein